MELVDSVKEENGLDDPWEIVYSWWVKICDSSGDKASLKRARTPDIVALQKSYLNLYREMYSGNTGGRVKANLARRLPLVAGVLSHVRDNRNEPVALVMGGSSRQGADSPLVSDLRFRRLMRTEDDDSLFIMMIRMVRMMDNRANVKDLAESLFFWNDTTRKKWTSRYYLHKDIYSENRKDNK